MTIRLLCHYGKYPANAIVTLDAGTEAGLVLANQATTNTTGGVPYVPTPEPDQVWGVSARRDSSGNLVELTDGSGASVDIGASDPNGAYLGPVSNRCMPCNQTNLTKFELMANAIVEFRVPVKEVRVRIPNWYVASLSAPSDFSEANLGTAAQAKCAIAYPVGSPTPTQGTQNGNAVASIPAGTTGEMLISFPEVVPAHSKVDVRIWLHNDGGIYFNGTGYGAPGDGLNTGVTTADLTMTNTALGTTRNGPCFLPVNIIGITTADTEAYIGDSICAGTGDTPDASGDIGIFARTLGKTLAYTNMGIGSETVARLASSSSALRRAEMAYAKRMRVHCGTNDLLGSNSAIVLASLQSLVNLLNPNGSVPVHVSTVIPRPSSTDGATTINNQVAWVQEARRKLFNRAVRQGQITGIAGIHDPCQYLEAKSTAAGAPTTESGLFTAYPALRTVTDGTTTAGSSTVTSPTAAFTASDDGQLISISGAGAAGATIVASIVYVSATSITLRNAQTGSAINVATSVAGTSTLNIACDRVTSDLIHPNRAGYLLANA